MKVDTLMRILLNIVLIVLLIPFKVSAIEKKEHPQNNKTKPVRKHVYILPGFGATPADHWFPWLKNKLTKNGYIVDILEMPNPSEPELAVWLNYLEQNIRSVNEQTYFVAHSLGCIALLQYLNALTPDTKIGGLVLVLGFTTPLELLPELDEFTKNEINFEHLTQLTNNRLIIASQNDTIVPFEQTKELGELMNTRLISIAKGGHFLAEDGFTQLPEVYDELVRMMHNN